MGRGSPSLSFLPPPPAPSASSSLPKASMQDPQDPPFPHTCPPHTHTHTHTGLGPVLTCAVPTEAVIVPIGSLCDQCPTITFLKEQKDLGSRLPPPPLPKHTFRFQLVGFPFPEVPAGNPRAQETNQETNVKVASKDTHQRQQQPALQGLGLRDKGLPVRWFRPDGLQGLLSPPFPRIPRPPLSSPSPGTWGAAGGDPRTTEEKQNRHRPSK